MGKIVYHYCSVESFINIIKTKELWLTDVTKSNDSSELQHAYNELKNELKTRIDKCKETGGNSKPLEKCREMLGEFNIIDQLIHVCCFSTKCDSLSQWSMYADNATGIAIGFDSNYFRILQKERKGLNFDKVNYSLDSFTDIVNDNINQMLDEYDKFHEVHDSWLFHFTVFIMFDIMKMFCFYKHWCFKQENEYRITYNSKPYVFKEKSKDNVEIVQEFNTLEIPIKIDDKKNYKEILGGIDYYVSKGKMVSYRPLHINDLNNAIKEIVIGPKSVVNEHDVKVFLAANKINIPDDKIIRSGTTYQ